MSTHFIQRMNTNICKSHVTTFGVKYHYVITTSIHQWGNIQTVATAHKTYITQMNHHQNDWFSPGHLWFLFLTKPIQNNNVLLYIRVVFFQPDSI